MPFLKGILLGMPVFLITIGFLTRTPFDIKLSGLFLWAWIRGPGFPLLTASTIIVLVNFFKFTSFSTIRASMGLLSGMSFVYLFYLGVTPDPGFNAYRLFFQPVLWLSAAISVAWLSDRAVRSEGLVRYVLFGAAVSFSTLYTFLQVLYFNNFKFVSWIIAAAVTFGSVFLILLDSRGKLTP